MQIALSPAGLASSFAASYAGVLAFIAVVQEGSFSTAAVRLGVGRSAVSRSILKLEAQIDTRLFARTTRSTTLTADGQLFYDHCRPGVEGIVHAVEQMQALRTGAARGQLRISAATGFGRKVVAPLLPGFRAMYPDIGLDLLLDDRPANFGADRIDVAFRNGKLPDSQVIAKQLIPMPMLVCAAPAYIHRHGAPQSVAALAQHTCINFRLASGRMFAWEFAIDGKPSTFAPECAYCCNDADLVLQAVLDGAGIAQMAAYQVCEHVRAGRLVVCLPQYAVVNRGHYICYPSRRHMPLRLRVFIDYMTQAIRALDMNCSS